MKTLFIFFLICTAYAVASAPWLNENKTGAGIIEGDIALQDAPDSNEQTSTTEDRQAHAAVSSLWDRKWKNNIVPFSVSKLFKMKQRATILLAMENIQQKTCISFVERNKQRYRDYILFEKVLDRSRCSSLVGREGGRQHVYLTDKCVEHDTVLHELMHVLGFNHEHTRHDRDKNIKINLSNVMGKQYEKDLVAKRNVDPVDSLVRYDHKSITHYPEDAFSAYNNRKTIISKVRGVKVQSNGLSEIDVWKINYIYNCSNRGKSVASSNEHAEETTTNIPNIYTTTVDQQRTTSQLPTIQSTIKQVQTTSSTTIMETSIGTTAKMKTSTTTRPTSISNKEIIDAIEVRNETRVEQLLNEGADVNAREIIEEYRNNTLLHIAAGKGHATVVSLLIDKGANIEARGFEERTALHYAARNGHVDVVSLLLDKAANIEAGDVIERTALHHAAWNGHVNVVTLLLDKGANIKARSMSERVSEQTPLHNAAWKGHANVVSLLLDKGANIFAKGHWFGADVTPLDLAKRGYHTSTLEILERKQREIFNLNNEIINAVEVGNETRVEQLLNEGADVNAREIIEEYRNNTLLHIAARNGHVTVVSLLLDKGSNIEARGFEERTALHYAAQNGHINIVSLLLDKGANIEAGDFIERTALHHAAWNGCVNVVSLLLDKGANIFAKGHWFGADVTPLDLAKRGYHTSTLEILERKQREIFNLNNEIINAVEVGNTTRVEQMLNKGADVNAREIIEEYRNNTLLHIAARNGHVTVVSLLLDKGSNIEARGFEERTALHYAAQNGHINIVSLLLDKGANIEAGDLIERTPLHSAARNGHANVVSLLLDKGANIFAKRHWFGADVIPLDLAKRGYHTSTLEILERKQREISNLNNEIINAVEVGNETRVEQLLNKGADVNAREIIEEYRNNTLLRIAARKGHATVVSLLIDKGANIEARGFEERTALHYAARNGHVNVVSLLLDKGANIEAGDVIERTALHHAAWTGRVNVVSLLLDKGASIEARSTNDSTPLHCAAENGRVNVVSLLLDKGANIEGRNIGNSTPLHYAAERGHLNVVSLLLDKGANIEARNIGHLTPLHFAASSGQANVASLLLHKGANIEARSMSDSVSEQTPLHHAAWNGHVNVVSLLLDNGANIFAKGHWFGADVTPLDLAKRGYHTTTVEILESKQREISILSKEIINAVEVGNEVRVEQLLNEGVDVNVRELIEEYRNNTLLHIAARKGHATVVLLLINKGANIEGRGFEERTALHYAAENGHVNVVSLLLDKGANIEAGDFIERTALHHAAWNGRVNVVLLLLDNSANIFAKGHWFGADVTPLDLAKRGYHTTTVEILESKQREISILSKEIINAVEVGNEVRVEQLLNEGANVNAREIIEECRNNTLLHIAARNGHVTVVSLLLDKGANIEARGFEERTALHYAAQNGHINIVSLLLDKGANIEAGDFIERTALHHAAWIGRVYVVSVLLEKGANIEARYHGDWTPLHYASYHGSKSVVLLLLDNGANIFAKGRWFKQDETPLDLAKRGNEREIVEILERKQREIFILNNEIINAVEVGNETRVELLLNKGADVNARTIGEYRNNTLLHIAARKGHATVVSLLLDKGGNIEARDFEELTALHYAARNGHVNVVSLLLDKGANIEARGFQERSALHYAARNGHVNVVSLLLDKGANIEAGDFIERSALHYAAWNGRVKVVSLLAEKGANIEARYRGNWTPLHYASYHGSKSVVLLLLDNGANIFAKGRWFKQDETPLDLAKRGKKREIVEILERKQRQLIAGMVMVWLWLW